VNIYNRLAVFTAVFALLAMPLFATFADAKPKGYHRHYNHRAYATRRYAPSDRRLIGGDYVDSHGWRYRTGYGWDNTCLNLDYLPSQYACSNNRR
jgi:hypothetical protein